MATAFLEITDRPDGQVSVALCLHPKPVDGQALTPAQALALALEVAAKSGGGSKAEVAVSHPG